MIMFFLKKEFEIFSKRLLVGKSTFEINKTLCTNVTINNVISHIFLSGEATGIRILYSYCAYIDKTCVQYFIRRGRLLDKNVMIYPLVF